MTKDQVESIMAEQAQTEESLRQKTILRRDQQMAALRARMAARKKKKLDTLRDNQEHEKMEVSFCWSRCVH